MSRLVALYPPRWRARYGAELAALLGERPPTIGDRIDIVFGALDARLHPQLVEPASLEPVDERVTASRRTGWFALAGGVAWILGLVVAVNGPIVHDGGSTYRDGGGGLPFLILAMALLAVGIAGTAERLPRSARLARAAAWTAAGGGLLWAMAPWVLVTGAVAAVGFVALAVGAIRAGQWPAWSLVAVVVTFAVPVIGVVRVAVGDVGPSLDGWAHAFVALAVLWIVVALPLLTRSSGAHRALA